MTSPLAQASRVYSESYFPGMAGPPPAAPTVAGVSPASIVVATPTPVTVTGTGFTSSSKVWADEEQQLTTFVSATELTYTGQGDQPGTQTITVRNGGQTSNAVELTVTAAAETRSAKAKTE